MTLNEDFFEITACTANERHAEFTVRLDATHPIYRAHFPGNPVTPGVCIIRMGQELAEKWLGTALSLRAAERIRFLRVIDPLVDPSVRFLLDRIPGEEGAQNIAAVVNRQDGTALCRLTLNFREE